MKKVNWGLTALYILLPLLLIPVGVLAFPQKAGIGSSLAVGVLFAAVGWLIMFLVVRGVLVSRGKKKAEPYLDSQGFSRNYTFTSTSSVVYIDVRNGRIAVHSDWNPGKTYILSAADLTDARTEDGKWGGGFMAGTSQVRFVFTIGGMTFKVPTFTSNRRWRMDDGRVLEAISKADMYVEALNDAKAAALAQT